MTAAPDWLEALVGLVAESIEAHSPMGPFDYSYCPEDGDFWAIELYPTTVELHGGPHDGALVDPGYSLDLKDLYEAFDSVDALNWCAHPMGPSDRDHPSVSIEGRYQDHHVYLAIHAYAPIDEPPGMTLNSPAPKQSAIH